MSMHLISFASIITNKEHPYLVLMFTFISIWNSSLHLIICM